MRSNRSLTVMTVLIALMNMPTKAADCNSNGVDDSLEIAARVGLVHQFRLEGDGDDSIGTAHGAVGANVSFSASGVPSHLGQAAVFGTGDVSGNRIVVPHGEFNSFGAGDFAVSFWVRRDHTDAGDGDGLFDQLGSSGRGWHMLFRFNDKLRIRLQNDAEDSADFNASAAISDTQWHHVVFSADRDQTDGGVWYIDGAEDSRHDMTLVTGVIAPELDMWIGTRDSEGLDGALASVQFYDRALTQGDVDALYVVEAGSLDCNDNVIPDECEPPDDCNGNGVQDVCEMDGNDCNDNVVLDECELANDPGSDCNDNGVLDECEIASGAVSDCDGNGTPDECEIAGNDCDGNGVHDECDLDDDPSSDCNDNGVLDECETASGAAVDCNGNGTPDECEIAGNDCDNNGVLDECDLADYDCNTNGVVDDCEMPGPQNVFEPRINRAMTQTLGGLAVADLNGDGNLDLAVTGQFNDELMLRFGNGNGSFGPQISYEAGDIPQDVIVGDVNGDGSPDIVISDSIEDRVTVRINNGEGLFSQKQDYGTGDYPVALALGDINGDGDLDLIIANEQSNNVRVRMNNGNGVFSNASNYTVGNEPSGVSLGDVDLDGDLDMMVSNYQQGNVSVRFNNGNGGFAARSDFGMGNFPLNVVAADLDGDGDADMAVANYHGDLSVRLSNGDGTFAGKVTYSMAIRTSNFTLGDLDGDGDLDCAFANNQNSDTGNVSVRLNLGDGTFGPRSNYAAGNWPQAIALGDIDNDGDMDAVAAHFYDANVAIFPGINGDCNANGIHDDCDLADDPGSDCNANGILDVCEAATGAMADCNGNLVPDGCELAANDCDFNDVIDECEIAADPGVDCNLNGTLDACEIFVVGDFNGDGSIDSADYQSFEVVLKGPDAALNAPNGCGSMYRTAFDVDDDGDVDLADFAAFSELLGSQALR